MEPELAELRSLLSKARRVKSGDVVLPDDVNTLVDIAAKVVGLVASLDKFLFISQIFFQSESYRDSELFKLVEVPASYHYSAAEIFLHTPVGPLIETSIYSG